MNTVRYECYDQLIDVPDKYIPTLRRLNNGPWGIMKPWIEDRISGHAYFDMWGRSVLDVDINKLNKFENIIIALVNGRPVGWAIADDDNYINLYVQDRYRKGGIAKNLGYLWLKRLNKYGFDKLRRGSRGYHGAKINYTHPENFTHNEDAARVLAPAVKKVYGDTKKVRRLKHVLPRI